MCSERWFRPLPHPSLAPVLGHGKGGFPVHPLTQNTFEGGLEHRTRHTALTKGSRQGNRADGLRGLGLPQAPETAGGGYLFRGLVPDLASFSRLNTPRQRSGCGGLVRLAGSLPPKKKAGEFVDTFFSSPDPGRWLSFPTPIWKSIKSNQKHI